MKDREMCIVCILEWSLNSKNEMPNLNQTFSTVGGYEKSCEKVWGGSDPPTRSERPPKFM